MAHSLGRRAVNPRRHCVRRVELGPAAPVAVHLCGPRGGGAQGQRHHHGPVVLHHGMYMFQYRTLRPLSSLPGQGTHAASRVAGDCPKFVSSSCLNSACALRASITRLFADIFASCMRRTSPARRLTRSAWPTAGSRPRCWTNRVCPRRPVLGCALVRLSLSFAGLRSDLQAQRGLCVVGCSLPAIVAAIFGQI